MANPMKGEAQLGDYTLTFNFGVFCSLEVKTGMKMPQLLNALSEGLGFGELRDFVWAGLQPKHEGMTDQDVSNLIDVTGFETAAAAVGKAVTEFFGSQKEKAKNPPKAA